MSSEKVDAPIAVGARCGNYLLGERLAAGGMAEVYHAESVDRRHGARPVVLKRMHPHLAENREFVDMFIDEARISTRLEHSNIVRVFDFEATDRGLFLIMELVDGPDLLSIIKRCAKEGRRIPVEIAVYIACHTLEALDYAHQASSNGRKLEIVHRDVSPSNILITRRGHVKLADFGIARATERQQKTATGTLKGKYGYMSPEQVRGGDLDGRSDVFAMGIVLAEMLMSRRLFSAPGDLETLLMVRRGDLSRLDKYGAHIPRDLRAIVDDALQVDLDQRHQSAGIFRDALSDWLAQCERRTGAGRLAELIGDMEERGGNLCEWSARPSSERSSTTMSGPETKLARLAIKKRAALGRQIFALGAVSPSAEAPKPVVEDVGLGRYDGRNLAEPTRRSRARSRAETVELADGSLSEVHPIDLLCAIGHRRLTGVLVLRSGDRVKEAYFRNGHPDFVRSNVPEDRFGQYLVRKRVLTQVQLGRALAALPHFEGRLGQALVSLDLLKPVDAVRLLTEQVSHKLTDACSWRDGRYFFREKIVNPFPGLELRLNTLAIVGRSLQSLPNEMLRDWGKRYLRRKPTIDLERAAEFAFPSSLNGHLHRISAGRHALGEVVREIPTGSERRSLVAAAYVLWRCGHLSLPRRRTQSPVGLHALPEAGERRKYRRVEVHLTAALERRSPNGHTHAPVPVTLCHATCEGIGLRFGPEVRYLRRRERVVVRFLAGVRHLEMVGRVVWSNEGAEADVHAGIELEPALTTAAMREAYAAWIVGLLAADAG